MCSTRAVAESTNCSCALNPRHALEKHIEDNPVTSAIMIGLGRGLIWAVGIALTSGVWAVTGIVMALAWALNGLWLVLVWAWHDMWPVIQAPVVAVQPVKVAPRVAPPSGAVPVPGIAVTNWPTSKHNIVKVAK